MIWLVSYPKSGNTWLRLLLREYFKEHVGSSPFETKDSAAYWYQATSTKPLSGCTPEDLALLRSAAMLNMMTALQSHRKTHAETIVKSHMAFANYGDLPYFSTLWSPRVVYIYRDPRDILPSFADHLGKTHKKTAEIMNEDGASVGSFPEVISPLSTWSNHVRSWFGADQINPLVTSYERMHLDTKGVLRDVLKFYDWEPDEQVITHAVEKCAFDRLQEREAEEGFKERSEHQDRFFRRGVVGSHEDEVSSKLIEKIEQDHGDVMEALGYL